MYVLVWPMRTLAVAIRLKRLVRITFSAPVRRRAVGGPFLRAQVVFAVDGYARWLTGIERTARNRKGPCLFPPTQVNQAGAACAPSAAATSISAPTRRASSTSD